MGGERRLKGFSNPVGRKFQGGVDGRKDLHYGGKPEKHARLQGDLCGGGPCGGKQGKTTPLIRRTTREVEREGLCSWGQTVEGTEVNKELQGEVIISLNNN